MMTPATMALIGATANMSPADQARALKNDAWLALAGTGTAVAVLVLHARGRTQEAFGLAMVSTVLAGVGTSLRLFAAAEAARAAQ